MTNIEIETLNLAKSAFRKFIAEDEWEQRRYEIAKTMLPVCVEWYDSHATEMLMEDVQYEAASDAVGYADALIKILKGAKE